MFGPPPATQDTLICYSFPSFWVSSCSASNFLNKACNRLLISSCCHQKESFYSYYGEASQWHWP